MNKQESKHCLELMTVNEEKTKVVVFGRMNKKASTVWSLGTLNVQRTTAYNYLGVWLSANGDIKTNLAHLKTKSALITTRLNKPNTILENPSTTPIRQILQASLLPALNYIHKTFPGNLTKTHDKFQLQAYMRIFRLPNHTRGYMIRLERGLEVQMVLS